MPTGYTSYINDKKDLTFPQFAMICARAFGACVTMRDDSMDIPIPDEFKPSEYHENELILAEKELQKVMSMTADECEKESDLEFKGCAQRIEGYIEKSIEQRARYTNMLNQVKDWNPPTDEHVEFKKFMIDQIEQSIKHDCSEDYWVTQMPVRISGNQWKEKRVKELKDDIKYHQDEHMKEIERCAGRTKWVKDLRESLK